LAASSEVSGPGIMDDLPHSILFQASLDSFFTGVFEDILAGRV